MCQRGHTSGVGERVVQVLKKGKRTRQRSEKIKEDSRREVHLRRKRHLSKRKSLRKQPWEKIAKRSQKRDSWQI